jgi:hypothetical protein
MTRLKTTTPSKSIIETNRRSLRTSLPSQYLSSKYSSTTAGHCRTVEYPARFALKLSKRGGLIVRLRANNATVSGTYVHFEGLGEQSYGSSLVVSKCSLTAQLHLSIRGPQLVTRVSYSSLLYLSTADVVDVVVNPERGDATDGATCFSLSHVPRRGLSSDSIPIGVQWSAPPNARLRILIHPIWLNYDLNLSRLNSWSSHDGNG